MTLREARLRRRMKQSTVARKVGITQAAYSRFENFKREVSPDMRIKLAAALRMRYDTLWPDERIDP